MHINIGDLASIDCLVIREKTHVRMAFFSLQRDEILGAGARYMISYVTKIFTGREER